MADRELSAAAATNKAWPYEEARKLLRRWPDGKPAGAGPMLFETGYGPSGLPHIGTFVEVVRTTMVRRAYEELTGGAPTRLIAFSDDMDGLRKVPDNVPQQALLTRFLQQPLSAVPDPFGCHDSFAAHNNGLLRSFLDRFGFDYEFVSATARYRSGAFDDQLRAVLRHYGAILEVMLPTLRAERAATYSPVLPISPASGKVLQVPVEVLDAEAGLVAFEEDGQRREHCILSGGAKLQWKVDWAMRWVALGVDYEMYGKDLTDSGIVSGRIARILGGRKPEGLIYEMFLDEAGEKISKSKGNGLSIEQWLRYGPPPSLGYYAYREPRSAKSLGLSVIPRAIEDWQASLALYPGQDSEKRLGNPVHHVHGGQPPAPAPVGFGLLLNLASVLGAAASREQMLAYLTRHAPDATPERHPDLVALIDHGLAYNHDVVAPMLHRRAPEPLEAEALRRLDAVLAQLPEDAEPEAIQTEIYAIGKDPALGFASLRDWFRALYETLLGQSQGPRMGSFIALYGIEPTRRLIAEALART